MRGLPIEQPRQDKEESHMERLIRECQEIQAKDPQFHGRLKEALKNG